MKLGSIIVCCGLESKHVKGFHLQGRTAIYPTTKSITGDNMYIVRHPQRRFVVNHPVVREPKSPIELRHRMLS